MLCSLSDRTQLFIVAFRKPEFTTSDLGRLADTQYCIQSVTCPFQGSLDLIARLQDASGPRPFIVEGYMQGAVR